MAPKQKPHKSKQDVQTPQDLLDAIKRDFGVRTWTWDLAANEKNTVSPNWFGPGGAQPDSLAVDWRQLDGDLWLNPEFGNIDPWAEKCADTWKELRDGARIFLLTPASVGSNWFDDHVFGIAHVVALAPRVIFCGHSAPYPKDLVCSVFSRVTGGFSTWRWK
jgi:hypothetical protein